MPCHDHRYNSDDLLSSEISRTEYLVSVARPHFHLRPAALDIKPMRMLHIYTHQNACLESDTVQGHAGRDTIKQPVTIRNRSCLEQRRTRFVVTQPDTVTGQETFTPLFAGDVISREFH